MMRALVFCFTLLGTLCHGRQAQLLSALSPYSADSPSLSLTVHESEVVNVIPSYYASWNIDPSRDRRFFITDFSDDTLLYMASGIGGTRIRFGGTGADHLFYEMPGAPECGHTVPTKYECLNTTWFDNLAAISKAGNSPMIFGLNIHPANASSPPEGEWNSSNARALLEYARDTGFAFDAVELGNEQNDNMTPEQQAQAFRDLSDVLDQVYGGSKVTKPKMAGPDPHSFHTGTDRDDVKKLAFLVGFVNATKNMGVDMHAITHHEYLQADEKTVLDPEYLNSSSVIANKVIAAVSAINPDVEVWAGEIAMHIGGTNVPNPNCYGNHVCGKFGSSLWYADSMANKARAGYKAFCRQDFIGADYGLLNYTTYEPTPDYYLLQLWQQLVPNGVLDATVEDAPDTLRAYAHCNVTHLTFVIVNLNQTTGVSVNQSSLPGAAQYTGKQFSLTADGKDGVRASGVCLNGSPLQLSDGHLPSLPGMTIENPQSIEIPPLSVSFLVFPLGSPRGTFPACSESLSEPRNE